MSVRLEDSEENKNESMVPQELLKQLEAMQKKINELEAGKKQLAPPSDSNMSQDVVEMLFKKLKGEADVAPLTSFEGYTAWGEIDTDDLLHGEDQVTFFAPVLEYLIVDGIINGKPVKAPFKAIHFTHEATKRVRNGKETDVFVYSSYTCKSKRELEFLKSHQMFGIKFFERLKEAEDVDTTKAMKIAQAMTALQNIGAVDLMNMCKQRGIEPSNNLKVMRLSIAENVAEQQIKDEIRRNEVTLRAKQMEEALLKNN